MPRPTLYLLGGPTLLDANGAPMSGGPVQRHRLALLAQLVIAAPGAVSRDRLIGVLWPDRDAAGGRRLLNTAVAVLRQALGAGVIESVGDDLRLGPESLDIDVQQFERALDEGRLEDAVALCRGQFLEGFFLDDAEDFERWMDAQRLRLARRYTYALAVLAERSVNAGEHARAASWWRALHHAEPTNANIVRQLMDALDASGDPTGALAIEESHAAYMRSEMGLEPDRRVTARGDAIRTSLTAAKRDVPVPRVTRVMTPPEGVPPAAERPTRRRILVGAAGLVVVAAATLAARDRATAPPGATSFVTTVLPVTADSGSTQAMADEVAEQLARNLSGVSGIAVTGPVTLTGSANRRQGAPSIAGRLRRFADTVAARFELRDGAGRNLASVDVKVPDAATAMRDIADSVSLRLLPVLWGQRWPNSAARALAVATQSLPAMREYFNGDAYFARLQLDSAATALKRAVDLDSTFAMALFRLAEVNAWRGGRAAVSTNALMRQAMRYVDRLPPRDAAVLKVWELHERQSDSAWAAANQLAVQYPDDPDARMAVADVLFHSDVVRDISLDSQFVLWDRAIEADTVSARPVQHWFDRAVGLETPKVYDRYVKIELARSARRPASYFQAFRTVRWGALAAARDTMEALVRRAVANPQDAELHGLVLAARNALTRRCFNVELDCGDTIQWLLALIERPYRGTPFLWQRDPRTYGTLTWGMGRMSAPNKYAAGDAEGWAQNGALLAAFGYVEPHMLDSAEQAVRRTEPENWFRGFYLGLVAVGRGDTAGVRRALGMARRWEGGVRYNGDPDSGSFHRGAERALGGWAIAVGGDTARGLTEMKAGIAQAGYSGVAMQHMGTLVLAMNGMLAAWPRTRDEGITRIRVNLASVGHYWPWLRLQLARALDARGDSAEAADQYRRFATLWRDADPHLRHFGEEAAARAEALQPLQPRK